MSNLQLVKSEHFGEIDADIYSNGNDMFMTISQLAECLEYADKKGVERLIDRSPYLKSPEFSYVQKVPLVLGGTQDTRTFTEDGIYEITMLSRQPKAREFRAWIRNVLKALRTGQAKIVAIPPDYPSALRALATEVERNQALLSENTEQKAQVEIMRPKASYCDLVLQTQNAISTTVIAKDYGQPARWLNEILHQKGVQFKQNGVWILYQKHAHRGLTKTKTHTFGEDCGIPRAKVHTYWTQKGRMFIYELLKADGIYPLIEQDYVGA